MTATSQPRLPGRMLGEVASAGRENLHADHVARYDAKEDAGAAAEMALLQRLGLLEGATVVDIGTGTDQFTLAVAPHCAARGGRGCSDVVLTTLRDKVAPASTTKIEVVQAGFLTQDHSDGPADLVYSRYALHHLPDTWKAIALTRMRQMSRTDGVLRLRDVVQDFGLDEAEAWLEAWCATGGNGIVREWSRAELEEHVRDEHSTFTWLLEPMIQRAGFTVEGGRAIRRRHLRPPPAASRLTCDNAAFLQQRRPVPVDLPLTVLPTAPCCPASDTASS